MVHIQSIGKLRFQTNILNHLKVGSVYSKSSKSFVFLEVHVIFHHTSFFFYVCILLIESIVFLILKKLHVGDTVYNSIELNFIGDFYIYNQVQFFLNFLF